MVPAAMRGFIDLHSHWVAAIDDGAKTPADSIALLRGLFEAGFSTVVATPHMRPGMFNNTADGLRAAFERTRAALPEGPGLPALHLASEHYFDDVVFERLLGDAALPYPSLTGEAPRAAAGPAPSAPAKKRSALIEFPTSRFPARITHRIFDMMRRKLRPVIAHPERYEPVWDDPSSLDPLLDAGAVLQLDVAALAGRYGRTPRRTAEALLQEGYYHAASSDAHSLKDVEAVKEGIRVLYTIAGREEADFLLIEGPRRILEGTVET
jgi:protein-tyrosine phosphatase